MMYSYLMAHAGSLDKHTLRSMLKEHELYCLARWLKGKFNDPRSIEEIKDLIIEEYQICL